MNSDSEGKETHKEIDGFKLKRWERPREEEDDDDIICPFSNFEWPSSVLVSNKVGFHFQNRVGLGQIGTVNHDIGLNSGPTKELGEELAQYTIIRQK